MNSSPDSAGVVAPSDTASTSSHSLDSLPTDEFLKVVGLRVRTQRSTMSMSRKRLAEVSGVSERYLAQLESGQGNMSIALLRKVTSAIGMSLGDLLSAEVPEFGGHGSNQAGAPAETPRVAATNSSSGEQRVRTESGLSNSHLVPEL